MSDKTKFEYTHATGLDSEAIGLVAYNQNNKELLVTFRSGGSYVYADVPYWVYTDFDTADSARSYWYNTVSYDYKNDGNRGRVTLVPVIEENEVLPALPIDGQPHNTRTSNPDHDPFDDVDLAEADEPVEADAEPLRKYVLTYYFPEDEDLESVVSASNEDAAIEMWTSAIQVLSLEDYVTLKSVARHFE